MQTAESKLHSHKWWEGLTIPNAWGAALSCNLNALTSYMLQPCWLHVQCAITCAPANQPHNGSHRHHPTDWRALGIVHRPAVPRGGRHLYDRSLHKCNELRGTRPHSLHHLLIHGKKCCAAAVLRCCCAFGSCTVLCGRHSSTYLSLDRCCVRWCRWWP